ncbi:DUF2845 domain-containing protein [Tahibacter harae]|uniref:DUF2845 domain-containing protein n=1 Tax=Tahibacter harae TaxID=2963937 RepID=A0ABT1QU61_9GAMM|nr:DUF2845 domain-containing protein [Tahibacter harae]MCQ4165807.1 DUF2845 domain-containing protein [Tahibacter harae]
MKRLALLCLLLLLAAPAYALRCGSRVVNDGDRDFAVRERCGAPFYVEQFSSIDVRGADGPYETQVEDLYDAWYYNFGPRRLMVRLVFRNGELQNEETLGYGVNAIGDSCNVDALPAGTSAGEIVAYCGEPATRRTQREAVVRRDGRGNEQYRPVRREEWTYDLGANQLLRILTLHNGRLQSVDVEGR